ncbi:MAG: hypothetical protein RLZZ294_986, partial [Bacteroidota bacterium]
MGNSYEVKEKSPKTLVKNGSISIAVLCRATIQVIENQYLPTGRWRLQERYAALKQMTG